MTGAILKDGWQFTSVLARRRTVVYSPVMRNVILGLGISLDGYIARPNGAVDFLFVPKDYSMAPFFATIDTMIMGRKTLDAALQMGRGAFSGSSMATYVFSRSKPPGERDGLSFVNQSPSKLRIVATSERCEAGIGKSASRWRRLSGRRV